MSGYQVSLTGRNVEIPDHFEERIKERLEKVSKLDPTLTHFDVELKQERNPRREAESARIQITATGSGHVARAEAKEDSYYAALDTAVDKMERSLRKVKVRRDIPKSGHRAPVGMGVLAAQIEADKRKVNGDTVDDRYVDTYADTVDEVLPGRIVREKSHPSEPMTAEDALGNMEALDHDFYLFVDSDTGKPSVVYRRHAFDYGLIALD